MDVHSLGTARRLERERRQPAPLDAVIRVAKEAEEADKPVVEEEEIKQEKKEKLKPQALMMATLAAAKQEAAQPEKRKVRKKSKSRRQKDLGVDDGAAVKDENVALESGYGNPKEFLSAVRGFQGRQVGGRSFPHGVDQTWLRREEGAPTRTRALNQVLRAGREARYNQDLGLLRDCELGWMAARGRQSDGSKFRLGRVGDGPASWKCCGYMTQRGRILTFRWQKHYWVLHDGLLYAFSGSSLAAPLRTVLPVRGAKLAKTAPSHRNHPFSFEVTINPFFMEDELLATTELAAPTYDEREKWMHAINEAACEVRRSLSLVSASCLALSSASSLALASASLRCLSSSRLAAASASLRTFSSAARAAATSASFRAFSADANLRAWGPRRWRCTSLAAVCSRSARSLRSLAHSSRAATSASSASRLLCSFSFSFRLAARLPPAAQRAASSRLQVSTLFRRTSDKRAHVESIDTATGSEMDDAMRLGRQVMKVANEETQRL